ncbi:MAG: tetratricopeptide repeat protein [Shimia sp.]|uniref:tetratricopeptide repeat protein n=1 Tax=Shimia sp. TaxID=1954381 RepID=UPI0040598D76
MIRATALLTICFFLAACLTGGQNVSPDSPFAPPVDTTKDAVDPVIVGWRLMGAGEFELALQTFYRAANTHGATPEILAAAGTANLGLGRLGQAEDLLRQSLDKQPNHAETWNNLGIVLMEKGAFPEAELVLKKAFALDNGESDAIRDNLRLVLAKTENPAYDDEKIQEYKLVRRGSSDYLIRQTPE